MNGTGNHTVLFSDSKSDSLSNTTCYPINLTSHYLTIVVSDSYPLIIIADWL